MLFFLSPQWWDATLLMSFAEITGEAITFFSGLKNWMMTIAVRIIIARALNIFFILLKVIYY